MIDDLMRQAGLEAIADKDRRAAAGQEMNSPEQDRYHAASYFAWLVDKAARSQALEEAANLYGEGDVAAPVGNSTWGEAHQQGWIDGTKAYRDAIRRLGEEAGRGSECLDTARLDWLQASGLNGTVRLDDKNGVCPQYIHWGASPDITLREAIDDAMKGVA
jgi:hypothetical protein